MPRYSPGLNEALSKVDTADEKECLQHLDALYGRDNLKYGASIEDVREEVRNQMRRDFTIPPTDSEKADARADAARVHAAREIDPIFQCDDNGSEA